MLAILQFLHFYQTIDSMEQLGGFFQSWGSVSSVKSLLIITRSYWFSFLVHICMNDSSNFANTSTHRSHHQTLVCSF
ncbi:hypothetical protein Mapa_016284 [Marchantia paleacea]|nr:hypothetical protein Mapa_016284 [Marchantia paleacea]